MAEGRFREPMVSWMSRDHDRRSVIVSIDGRVSLDELSAYLCEQIPMGEAATVTLAGSLRWEREATDAEREERRGWEAKTAERHAEWERRVWASLQEKFGPAGPPPPEEVPPDIRLTVIPPATDGAGRQLPGMVWAVRARHLGTGMEVTRVAEHKLSAVEQAIREVRALVEGRTTDGHHAAGPRS